MKIVMRRVVLVLIAILSVSLISMHTLAEEVFVGTLTSSQGHVQLFTSPGKAMSGPPPHALFEGEYYTVRDVKPGDKVKKGNIVRTSTGAQAKVVYENGDQVHVGPATSYKVTWEESGKKQTTMSLLYGKIRNVVSKDGPRNNMKVKAGGTVMGIRGTDFYVSKKGVSNTVEVTTLRGSVAVKQEPIKLKETAKLKETSKPEVVKPAEEIIVKSGFTAKVEDPTPAPSPSKKKEETTALSKDEAAKNEVAKNETVKNETAEAPKPLKIELEKTTKEELAVIKEVSTVKTPEVVVHVSKEVVAEIKKLETQAKETTMNDIKTYDPKLYEEIKQRKDPVDIDNINAKVVEKVAVSAPREVKKLKPTEAELRDLEKDSYEEYFKIVD